mmetsp:Transcript_13228/g.27260  ORF Transcript_13228/g.27260 Transcript_13228/m.27260 type:complete len:211 (+) Transcript_13228:278-910(+)
MLARRPRPFHRKRHLVLGGGGVCLGLGRLDFGLGLCWVGRGDGLGVGRSVGGSKESVQLLLSVLVQHLDTAMVCGELVSMCSSLRGVHVRSFCLERRRRLFSLVRLHLLLGLLKENVELALLAPRLVLRVLCVHHRQLRLPRLGLRLELCCDLLLVLGRPEDQPQLRVHLLLLRLLAVEPRLLDFSLDVALQRRHVSTMVCLLRLQRILE